MAIMDQVKSATTNINTYWKKQSPKAKKIFIGGAGLVLAVAIIITVVLNTSKNSFEVLFPGSSAAENVQVYAALQEQGVLAQMSDKGEVMVPKEQLDKVIFDMQMEGFPKTSTPYGIVLDNLGPTSTEFDKQLYKLYGLQDRIQDTLRRVDGIKDAMVTINLPEQSDRVWETNSSEATASVLLTLKVPGELEPQKVSTIKSLVAANLPNGKPENIVVTDASTSVELDSANGNTSSYNTKRLEFEKQIQKGIEDNVKRLLVPTYGADGVVAVSTVVLDYDKMKSESKEIVPKEDGKGVIKHEDESYTANGGIPTNGIAGEDQNTDIPGYAADDTATTDDIKTFDRNIDYDWSYIMTQLERGEAPITKSTISVMLNEPNLTQDRRDVLIDLISNAVNIDPQFISVSSMDIKGEDANPEVPVVAVPFYQDPVVWIIVGGSFLLILLIAIAWIIIARTIRRRKEEAEEARLFEEQAAAISAAQKAQAEIDQHKNRLRNEAEAQKIQEGSMTEEIRSFAKESPEMTAVLIRSLLKEDE